MHTMQVVYQVAKHNYIRLVRKLVFIRLHVGLQVSGVYPLTGGRQTRNLAITPVMSANLILESYYIFTEMSNLFSMTNIHAAYIPQAKAWGFDGRSLNFNTQVGDERFRSKIRALRKVKHVVKLLREDGWYEDRMKGSHRQFHHRVKLGAVTVAGKMNADVRRGTLNNILKQAELKP